MFWDEIKETWQLVSTFKEYKNKLLFLKPFLFVKNMFVRTTIVNIFFSYRIV